jgi:cytochrome c-type biogenesis protein CcmF
MVSFGVALAAWIVATSAVSLWDRVKPTASGARFTSTSFAFYGMLLAHVGVAVLVVGVTLVKGYGSEKDVRMEPGDTVELAGYTFLFRGVTDVSGPNYLAARAIMEVTRNGALVAILHPEKRRYRVQENPMTEAAIDAGITRDLYVTLGDRLNARTWLVRVQHKPFVGWIWGGAVLMALGGWLAAGDRRYRVAARLGRET